MRLSWKFGRICFAPEDGTGGGTTTTTTTTATEHPVSAPWAEAQGVWNIGEGDKAAPWWSTLPDEAARKHIEAKQYANPAELALANYNLTRMQTGDPQILTMPAADATPEQMRTFYEKLGAPKEAAGYELKFADGVQVSDTMVNFGKDAFHKAGLTPAQAQVMSDTWNEFAAKSNAAAIEADAAANQQALDKLTSSWGAELDANKAAGLRAMQGLGLSAESVNAIEGAVGSAPIVELLATLGKKTAEGGMITGNLTYDANNPETMTKEQAQSRITELQADTAFMSAYNDKTNPQHAEKVNLMQRLFAKI